MCMSDAFFYLCSMHCQGFSGYLDHTRYSNTEVYQPYIMILYFDARMSESSSAVLSGSMCWHIRAASCASSGL